MKHENSSVLSVSLYFKFTLFLTIAVFVIFFWINVSDIESLSKISRTGSLGDTLNGITAPFIMLVTAFLTFNAFKMQFDANEIQKSYIKRQRFEDTFFRLLDNHQRIVDAMDLVSYKSGTTQTQSAEVNKIEKKPTATIVASKRDCFKKMFKKLRRKCREKNDFSIQTTLEHYGEVQNIYKGDLHHYYRLIYRILKFVKESDIEVKEKYNYTSIFRALFSPYELVMIFYNGLHPFGKKLKPLLEEYSFLKNIDRSLLIQLSDKQMYHDLAMPDIDQDRIHLLEDWSKNNIKVT